MAHDSVMGSCQKGVTHMLNKILVAFKFTNAGKYAVQKGMQLARDHNAELHVFHALDYKMIHLDDSDPTRVCAMRLAEKRFEKELKRIDVDLPGCVTFNCRPADPAMETCRHAGNIDADLIVLGAHKCPARESLSRIDYVGMTILEKSPCPVMLVHR